MSKIAQDIASRVNGDRLREMILDLVGIPSPPGQEKAVAERYGEYLREAGVQVEFDAELPESPSVVGRIHGKGGGPTLQFDGHTDTIAVPGPRVRVEGHTIYGRGTEDMKGDLACVAEAVRLIVESGVSLPGDILVTAHGMHEPGTNETLEALIRKKIYGDAVIVSEGFGDRLPIVGLGLGIWELQILRDGEPVHENQVAPGTPHPIAAGMRALELLREKSEELKQTHIEYLGSESIFIGKFQSGDYFNRLPNVCTIAGSRRFGPDKSLADIRQEFEALAREVQTDTGARVEAKLSGLESFRVAEDEAIVGVIRRAHRNVMGKELPLCGIRTVGNLSNFVKTAGIPGVYYGIGLKTAHSDNECIDLREAVQATKVFIHAVCEYFGV